MPFNDLGGAQYWNASTNEPKLVSGQGQTGQVYRVGVAGSTLIDGVSSWALGDLCVFILDSWLQIKNPVSSSGGPTGPASGELDGTYPGPVIRDGAVVTDRLGTKAVTAAKVADKTLTNAQIADRTISQLNLALNSVDSNIIADNSVSGPKIPSYAIDATKLLNTVAGKKDFRTTLRIDQAWDFYDLGMSPSASGAASANTAALQAGIYAARAAGIYRIIVPSGTWYINNTIIVDYGVSIEGIHQLNSVIISLSINNIFNFVGTYGTGGALKRVSLGYDLSAYAPGTIANVALYAYAATGSVGAHGLIIEDIRITTYSANLIYYGVILDGAANTTGTPGIRGPVLRNVEVFQIASGGVSIDIRHGRSVICEGVVGFATGGGVSFLQVTGPNATYRSSGVQVNGGNFSTVIFGHCDQCFYQGWVGTTGSLSPDSNTTTVIEQGVTWTDSGTGNRII